MCKNTIPIEIGQSDASLYINCENCSASLDVSYTLPIDIDVIVDAINISYICPKCRYSLDEIGISDESGSEEVNCSDCNSLLEVRWDHWGQDDVDVIILEEEEEEEDDDDDDDDEN